MKKLRKKHDLFMGVYVLLLLLVVFLAFNCSPSRNRDNGVFVMILPLNSYQLTPDSLPFRFQFSEWAKLEVQKNRPDEYFCNIIYSDFHTQLYCTWHQITPESFNLMAEESRRIAFQHTAMATAINEDYYRNDFARVYGLIYDIKGEVATPLQLAITDSVSYFFNASLYFSVTNKDSVNTLLTFVRKDVVHLIETFTPHSPDK